MYDLDEINKFGKSIPFLILPSNDPFVIAVTTCKFSFGVATSPKNQKQEEVPFLSTVLPWNKSTVNIMEYHLAKTAKSLHFLCSFKCWACCYFYQGHPPFFFFFASSAAAAAAALAASSFFFLLPPKNPVILPITSLSSSTYPWSA